MRVLLVSRLQTMTVLMVLLMTAPAVQANSIVINGERLFDPTQPPGVAVEVPGFVSPQEGTAATPRNYRVSFIRAGGDRPTAVINNELVGLGDEVAGATVLAIEPGVVTLWINGQEERISTFAGDVRQPLETQ